MSIARVLGSCCVLLLCACQTPGVEAESPVNIAGTAWRAAEIDGRAVHREVASTLRFDEQGGVSGSAGCNRYFGTLSREGEGVSVGPLGTTRMMCAPPIMDQEQRFLRTLQGARRLELRRGDLLFFGEGEAATLRLTKAVDE